MTDTVREAIVFVEQGHVRIGPNTVTGIWLAKNSSNIVK